jgi:hypothetical protein
MLGELPEHISQGHKSDAFTGGLRMWDDWGRIQE